VGEEVGAVGLIDGSIVGAEVGAGVGKGKHDDNNDDPATEKVFAGQGVHADDPLIAAYVLAGQARQAGYDDCRNRAA